MGVYCGPAPCPGDWFCLNHERTHGCGWVERDECPCSDCEDIRRGWLEAEQDDLFAWLSQSRARRIEREAEKARLRRACFTVAFTIEAMACLFLAVYLGLPP